MARQSHTLGTNRENTTMRLLAFCLALLTTPALAHELWIEPESYLIEPDGRLVARLVNGQHFDGIDIAYFPQRIVRFEVMLGDEVAPVEARMGANPAMDSAPLGEGLHRAVYVSTVSVVKYADYAAFDRFVAHKDFQAVRERHLSRGLPEADFGEAYTRYSKALIGVGDAAGDDARAGLAVEIVALDNPYTADLAGGMRVQVFWQDGGEAYSQVELFDKAPDGSVTITLHRTNAEGIAILPVQPGHSYLADHVVLRAPSAALAEETGAVWETLWAALTFAVPAAVAD